MGAMGRSSREDGFTLLELVIVAIIIGILATIAIAVFLGQRDKAERSSAISSARNTMTLAEAIRLDDPTYTEDPSAYEAEGGRGFTFVNGPSTGPTVVSIATFDSDRIVVIASRGGGRCYWVRREVGENPVRGYDGLSDGETCTAEDTALENASGAGW